MHFYESFARSAGFADMLKASKARAEKPDAEPLRPALAHFIESDRPDAWRLYKLTAQDWPDYPHSRGRTSRRTRRGRRSAVRVAGRHVDRASLCATANDP